MRRVFRVLFVVAVAIYVANLLRYADYVVDDSFISLRYAKNLVEGHGLVFNPGERVEGYTNLLFVLVAAAFMKIGLEPVLALKVLCVMASCWVLVLLIKLERLGRSSGLAAQTAASSSGSPLMQRASSLFARQSESRERSPQEESSASASLSPLLWLLPLEAFAYWSVCPMETAWFAALLLSAVYLSFTEMSSGRYRGSLVLFVLLSLTRPEGAYLFAVSTVAFAIAEYVRTGGSVSLRRHIEKVALFGLFFVGYSVWRYHYYGELLPNTFYAKVTGATGQLSTGFRYLGDFALSFPVLAATALLPLALLHRSARDTLRRHAPIVAVYLIVVAYGAYVVLIGGDSMPHFRFFVPIMPLGCLLVSWSLGAAGLHLKATGRWARVGVIAVWLVHLGASLWTEESYRAFVADRTTIVGERAGRWFAANTEPDDLIAVNTAGSLPYYSERPALDMLGLTDRQIARREVFIISTGWSGHRRGWGRYVLDRRPRAILWYNSAGLREPFYLGDHEMADDPYFRFFYRLRSVDLPDAVAPADYDDPVARFLGFPFGFDEGGKGASRDLGVRMRFNTWPLGWTTMYEGPVTVTYFEPDPRDAGLWALRERFGDDLDGFLAAVVERWKAEAAGKAPPDKEARARVEAMCGEAYRRIQAGHYDQARSILSAAAASNESARSPLVYQYMANLGVMTGDVFVAVTAQKEALRMAPESALHLGNLAGILRAPFEQATQARAPDAAGSGSTGGTDGTGSPGSADGATGTDDAGGTAGSG